MRAALLPKQIAVHFEGNSESLPKLGRLVDCLQSILVTSDQCEHESLVQLESLGRSTRAGNRESCNSKTLLVPEFEQLPEIVHGMPNTLFERDSRRPVQVFFGEADVRSPLGGIIARQRVVAQGRF